MYQKFEIGDRVKWIENGEEIIGVVLDRVDFEDGTYEYSFRIDQPHPESWDGEPIKIDTEEDQTMTREEYRDKEKQLRWDFEKQINDLRDQYIADHAEFNVGDTIAYKCKKEYAHLYQDMKRRTGIIIEVTVDSFGRILYIVELGKKGECREAVHSEYFNIKKIQQTIW